MKEQRLAELFGRFMYGGLPDTEEKELLQLWLDPELDVQRNKLLDAFYNLLPEDKDMTSEEADLIFLAIVKTKSQVYQLPRRSRVSWRRWVAVASVILMVGAAGSLFLFHLFNEKDSPKPLVHGPAIQDIIPPKINKAMISLADGKTVDLDSTANGQLALQGNVKLVKLTNGQIVYKKISDDASASLHLTYNTLTNPKGSKTIDIALSDGSHVWLNAGSSVTFPVAFAGNERRISMTGEAYLEVSTDAAKPFVVTKGETAVKVLGTRFNINAYDNEEAIEVTLLEGSVSVNTAANSQHQDVVIKPGQQAVVTNKIGIKDNVDIEQVVAWKNGLFEFRETDIQTIMRQIERWYDVDVVFEGTITQHFNGKIQREVNISKVLHILEEAGGLKFSVENKKVVIKKEQLSAD